MKDKFSILLMVPRGILVVVLLVFMVMSQMGGKTSRASVDQVASAVLSSIEVGDGMQESTNRMLKKIYGLNAADFDGVKIYCPVSGMDAEEMLIIKLKDSSSGDAVLEAIRNRLNSQKSSFDGYGVEQTALLNAAVLEQQGNFVFYIVHDQAQEAAHAFRNSL